MDNNDSDEALYVIACAHKDDKIREIAGLKLLDRLRADSYDGISAWFFSDGEKMPGKVAEKARAKLKDAVNIAIANFLRSDTPGKIITDILYNQDLEDSAKHIAQEIVLARWKEFGSSAIKDLVRGCSNHDFPGASIAFRNLLNLAQDKTLSGRMRKEAREALEEAGEIALDSRYRMFYEELQRLAKSDLFSNELRIKAAEKMLESLVETFIKLKQCEEKKSSKFINAGLSEEKKSYEKILWDGLQEMIENEAYPQEVRGLAFEAATSISAEYLDLLSSQEDDLLPVMECFDGQEKPAFIKKAARERMGVLASELAGNALDPEMRSNYLKIVKGKPGSKGQKKLKR